MERSWPTRLHLRCPVSHSATVSKEGRGDQRERDSSDFVNAADLALFRAKSEGRDRVPRLVCRRREELRQAGPEL
ncbi:MAG: hypothetical protein E5V28_17260 [Mesorhizobium sp.]|nr:MAG: hypothetical protein E5V28_17260 [Mesorhizobium sp.]